MESALVQLGRNDITSSYNVLYINIVHLVFHNRLKRKETAPIHYFECTLKEILYK